MLRTPAPLIGALSATGQPVAVAVIPGPLYRRLFESEPAIQNLTVSTLSTLVYRLMTEFRHLKL